MAKTATVPPHVFAWDGVASGHPLKPVRYCTRCPLPESRDDVHTLPETPTDVTEAEQRRYPEER